MIADKPALRTATTLMLPKLVTTPVTVDGTTFDAATPGGSWLSVSILAGMIATPMLIAVMATAAIPQAARGTDVS